MRGFNGRQNCHFESPNNLTNNLFRNYLHVENLTVKNEQRGSKMRGFFGLMVNNLYFICVLCPFTVQTCDAPPQPSYGKATPELRSKYLFGNIVQYQCNNGFSIRGHKTTRCQIYGNWSNPVPTCASKFRFSSHFTSCL